MKQQLTIFTHFTDNESVLNDFNTLLLSNQFAKGLHQTNSIVFQTSISVLEKKEIEPCDILIIEDDIRHIIQYFALFSEASEVSAIYVCTKKQTADTILLLLQGKLQKTKLVILDFDLNEKTTTNEKLENAFLLYTSIVRKVFYDMPLNIVAITAYETSEIFSQLTEEMRTGLTLVLSKDFLEAKNKNLLECIFRNVPGIFNPLKCKEKSKKVKVVQPHLVPSTSLQLPIGKLQAAENLLERINAAIPDDEVRFQITKRFSEIEKKNGGFYSLYQTICQEVGKNKEAINYLLTLQEHSNRWVKMRFQISKYRLFSTQLT